MASRKGYAIRLSALQIQSFVTLQDKLGDIGSDPILESIFDAVRTAWTNEVLPAEMGQVKPTKKRVDSELQKEAKEEQAYLSLGNVEQFETRDPELQAEEAKELAAVITKNSKKK